MMVEIFRDIEQAQMRHDHPMDEDQVHELSLMLKIPPFANKSLGTETYKSDGCFTFTP